jgi:hypothetical protein
MTNSNLNTEKASATGRLFAAAGVLAVAGMGFAAIYFNPVTAGFFPQCPLHAMTGLNCPGCGLTRGFHALFQGDLLTALHFNALLPIYALIFGYLFTAMFLLAVRGRGLNFKIFPPYALWIFLAISIVFGILRNLPFYPFNLLAI